MYASYMEGGEKSWISICYVDKSFGLNAESPNSGKCGPQIRQIWTLFTQWERTESLLWRPQKLFLILGTNDNFIICIINNCIIAIDNFPSTGNDNERIINKYQSDNN